MCTAGISRSLSRQQGEDSDEITDLPAPDNRDGSRRLIGSGLVDADQFQ